MHLYIDCFSSMITPSPKAGIAFGEGWGGVAPYQLDIPKDRIRFYSFQGQSMASVAKQAALPEASRPIYGSDVSNPIVSCPLPLLP
jgi:hypothetical protein